MTVIQKDPRTAPQKIICISREERKIIEQKIYGLMKSVGADILIAADPTNFSYVSGVNLPYANQFGTPKAAVIVKDTMNVICPAEWAQLPADQDRSCDVAVYSSKEGLFTNALVKHIAALAADHEKVAVDSADLPVAFMMHLEKALPGAEFIDISSGIKNLRSVKTDAEIRMLENAIRFVDRAAVAALNHSEGQPCDTLSYYMWEFAERIRVHIGEFGGSGSGNITALQGSDMRFLSKSPVGTMKEGSPIRFEATGNHLGYWGYGTRTFFIGKPTPEFESDYRKNVELKKEAVKALRPGVRASEVYHAVLEAADRSNTAVFKEAGVGHGIGLCEMEAPYLCPSDTTVLTEGMVIVLAIYTYGPEKELICSRDTYEITENGCRLMSWYKNYDNLYTIDGTHARHG